MTVVKIPRPPPTPPAPNGGRPWLAILGIPIFLGLAVAYSTAFTLSETEQAVVVQLGNPVREITEAGLYFKVPFIQEVRRFDRRIQAWDGDPNEIPTAGGEFIWVDTTARWRIVRPQKFMESVRDEASARSRLSDVIDSVVRDQIAGTQLVEIVRSSDWGKTGVTHPAGTPSGSPVPVPPGDPAVPPGDPAGTPGDPATPASEAEALESAEVAALTQKVVMGREALTRAILAKSKGVVEEYGIELVDVQIKRINYVASVQEQVFKRMISDQQRRAEEFRSEGQGESARILGESRRELATIQSTAEREAQIIRGQADAEATRIYNEAFSSDTEFYALWRTLESYQRTVDGRTTLFLATDAEYYRYLQGVSR